MFFKTHTAPSVGEINETHVRGANLLPFVESIIDPS